VDTIDFLYRLRRALVWETSDDLSNVQLSFERTLSEKLQLSLLAFEKDDPCTAAVLTSMVEGMDSKALAQFITFPHIASLILGQGLLSDITPRSMFLQLSLDLLGGTDTRSDKFFDAGSKSIRAAETIEEFFWSHNHILPLSFSTRLKVPKMDRGGNSLVSVSTNRQGSIVAKLQAARDIISTTSIHTHEFTYLNTGLLAFRSEDEYPDQWSSGSFRVLPGFSLMINYHLAKASELALADSIVHEAIHGVIYRFESSGNRLVCSDFNPAQTICSPWTGAKLSVDSFSQACLVWFGLYHFWGRLPMNKVAVPLKDRALKGFLSPKYSERCQEVSGLLHPGVAQFLQDLPRSLA
jgi:hypothetical protein